MSFFRRFLEQLNPKGVLLPAWRRQFGEQPTFSFETVLRIYRSDPAARAAVDFLADQVCGMGFYVTADTPRAKRIIDDFCESVNLDGLLQIGVREIIATGNSFWEKVVPKKLSSLNILPLTSIAKIERDKFGKVLGYRQSQTYGSVLLEPERVIHFRWNPINNEPFGYGLLNTLASSLSLGGQTRPSLASIKAQFEDSMNKIVKKYGGPTEVWKFPDAKDAKMPEIMEQVRNIPPEGARYVTNIKDMEVQVVGTDPRSRFEAYVDFIWNQYILGLQTPIPKLISTPGFTEASANAAIEVAERKVMALQRFVKRIVEAEIFTPVLEQAGLSPSRANVRLNWGMPERPEIRIIDLLKALELGAVSSQEVRAVLSDLGWKLEQQISQTEG